MDEPKIIKKEESNVKKYSFTEPELVYLRSRQTVLTQAKIVAMDEEAILKSYVLTQVLPRLAINQADVDININLDTGVIETTPKVVIAPQMPPK